MEAQILQAPARDSAVLSVENLHITIDGRRWHAEAVSGVTFDVKPGQILGIVGESGSGKSLTALALMGLLGPNVRATAGSARFGGKDLLSLTARQWRSIRGAEIAMVFQDPMSSLDASFTIGSQLIETIRAHQQVSRAAARERAAEMLGHVGIASARRRLGAYPHELSGGMRQRVMIAMALILNPKLLLLDEPTTALDVTTQAQIIELIGELQRELGLSAILISHDLGMVLDIAQQIVVMYAGEVVEYAPGPVIAVDPRHPYTQGLLRSKLHLLTSTSAIPTIDGQVPGLLGRSGACRFETRCANYIADCSAAHPELVSRDSRLLRCINPSPWESP
jgi:oligopeptide/dipeptide ABC transporter ATP-binding protein